MLCTQWASGSSIPGPRGKKLGLALGTHELCLQTVNTLKSLSKVRVFSLAAPSHLLSAYTSTIFWNSVLT